MSETRKVLDHGYVNFVEKWGSDERIIEAARMSTDGGFRGWEPTVCDRCRGMHKVSHSEPTAAYFVTCPKCTGTGVLEGDTKLLRFLYKHKHMTPFEMAGMVIEVQAPIFVFREWHRHRAQSYNEMSGRYTELPDIYYVPSLERLMAGKQSTTNKQSSTQGFSMDEAIRFRDRYQNAVALARGEYERMLAEGVSRELARLVLPVNQYSRMRASANLRNWLAFLTLRMDHAAQHEIRAYANIVADIIKVEFSRTYALFEATT